MSLGNTHHGASLTAARKPNRASARRSSPARTRKPSVTPRWWMLPVAVLVVVSAFTWTYYPVARVQYRETRERARLQAELDGITARNTRLERQVAALQTPEGVEDYARSRLGLVRPGEHVVIVTDDGASKSPTATAPVIDGDEDVVPRAGQWTAFLDMVFGVR